MYFLTYSRSKRWAHHANSKMNGIPGLVLKGLTVLQGETTQRRLWYETEGSRKSIRKVRGDHLGAGRSEWPHSHKHLFNTRCQATRIKPVLGSLSGKGDTNMLVSVIHRTKGNHSVVTASSSSHPTRVEVRAMST